MLLVTPLLGNNPGIRINRACIVTGGFVNSINVVLEESTHPDANKTQCLCG